MTQKLKHACSVCPSHKRGASLVSNQPDMTSKAAWFFFIFLSLWILSGCGGSASGNGGGTTPTGSLTVSLSNNSPLAFPSQANATVTVTLTRIGSTGNVTLAVTGLPSSSAVTVQSPGATNAGTITLGAGTASAGTYLATVTATDGAALATAPLTLTVGATTQVTSTVTGRLQLAMSTSFQPAEWDYQFFTNHPGAVTPLGNLQSQNIRLQAVSQGIPHKTPTTWDFAMVDAIAQPVLGVGDHSPEYQIALGAAFMYDSSHNFIDPT